MIALAIDTCDSRGSVAVIRADVVLASAVHETAEDYSSWLLPAVRDALARSGIRMADVDLYAVAAGPGSFTGVRVGLTTVKAWAEVYGKPVAAVSRLKAIGAQSSGSAPYVAAFCDAQRAQVFGAIYRRNKAELDRQGDERVLTPAQFLEWAEQTAAGTRISWVSPDAEQLLAEAAWKGRERKGETIEPTSPTLAPVIGRLGLQKAADGHATDALLLDANYVRRSDAEIFWKGRPAHGG